MDGWMDIWMDGWMDRYMDGWMDGGMDGNLNTKQLPPSNICSYEIRSKEYLSVISNRTLHTTDFDALVGEQWLGCV